MDAIWTTLIWLLAAQVTAGTPAPAGEAPAPPMSPLQELAPQGGFQNPDATPPLRLDDSSSAGLPGGDPSQAMPAQPTPPFSLGVEPAAAQQPIQSPAAPAAPTTPAVAPPPDTAGTQPATAPQSVTGARRPMPPEMVAEALTLPAKGNIKGRNLTLLEALSMTMDRRRQAEITHAYWRLVQAIADYHYSFEENAAIQQFQARGQDAAMWETAKASAAAALHASEVAAVEAQGELAETTLLPLSNALPLPADAPHVGAYRTLFDQMFAARVAPARIRLIDRTLPICRKALDVRAAAVNAAEYALEGTIEAYQQGSLEFSAVLTAMGQLGAQRRALIATVCQYNHYIADYVLSIAAPNVQGAALVGMLIRTPKSPQAAPSSSAGLTPIPESFEGAAYAVQPAAHNAPISSVPYGVPRPGQPTLAPPRPQPQPAPAGQSTPADSQWRSQQPTPAPPKDPAGAAPAELPDSSGAKPLSDIKPLNEPAAGSSSQVTPRTARRNDVALASAAEPSVSLYPGLVDVDPAVRLKQLSDTLHWDRPIADNPSQPLPLEECLRLARGVPQRQAILAYWTASQRASQFQVRTQTAEWLEQLAPAALKRRQEPSGALAMVRLQADKLDADADALDARAELLAAQFELTEMLGRPLDSTWLLPSTPPHAGTYLLKLEAQSPAITQSWSIRRLAASVPALTGSLQERATAVVRADTARAAATTAYENGSSSIDAVLTSIRQQTEQTLALLETLTDYNRSIGEYALAVLPPGVPAEMLVQTLVVK